MMIKTSPTEPVFSLFETISYLNEISYLTLLYTSVRSNLTNHFEETQFIVFV